jgi:hypothetical protein
MAQHREYGDDRQQQQRVIDKGGAGGDQRQAYLGKDHLLQDVAVLDKDRQASCDDIGEQRPAKYSGGQIYRISIGLIGQFR